MKELSFVWEDIVTLKNAFKAALSQQSGNSTDCGGQESGPPLEDYEGRVESLDRAGRSDPGSGV